MPRDLKFETETCSRCGGTGHYSYNQITGTRCFKCHGQKVTYTKRGYAAKKYADEIRALPVEEIKVGQRIYWGNGGRCTVTAIEDPAPMGAKIMRDGELTDLMAIKVHGRDGFTQTFQLGTKVRKGWTQAMKDKVMEYQDNLTKAGKPRKRKIKN